MGLGKTIEAALVLCQYWAESRRNLLIIAPAALRKQWGQELQDKFNLPVQVLDFITWKRLRQQGIYNPFDNKKSRLYPIILLCEWNMKLAKLHGI